MDHMGKRFCNVFNARVATQTHIHEVRPLVKGSFNLEKRDRKSLREDDGEKRRKVMRVCTCESEGSAQLACENEAGERLRRAEWQRGTVWAVVLSNLS